MLGPYMDEGSTVMIDTNNERLISSSVLIQAENVEAIL